MTNSIGMDDSSIQIYNVHVDEAITAYTSRLKSLILREIGKIDVTADAETLSGTGKQHGIGINEVRGTGKDGRVLKDDVLDFAVKKGIITKTPSVVLHADIGKQLQGAEEYSFDVTNKYDRPSEDTILPLREFQRAMVKSMSLAAKVPHFHYVEEIICDALVELKTSFQKNNPYPDVEPFSNWCLLNYGGC